jgi:adenosine deaminase
MSLDTYIQAMPKVDVHIHFEGSLPRDTISRIVDQNDIAASMRQREYNEWMGYLNKPDYRKIDDLARVYASWLKYPEDLSRAVYDVGVALYKQNVRYAEMFISPAIYTDNGLAFEQFMDAINDGRDKVLRGWKVRMDWVFTVPRDRPRKGDDIARWTTSATARKGNVVGMALSGREDVQPSDQFTKAFQAVERRDVPRVAPARSVTNAEPLPVVLENLLPTRLVDLWGIATDPEALQVLAERQIPIVVTPTREMRLGRIAHLKEYPMRTLLAETKVAIGANMPEIYRTNLTEELIGVAKASELTADDVDKLVLNALDMSFLPADARTSMREQFEAEFGELRVKHLN